MELRTAAEKVARAAMELPRSRVWLLRPPPPPGAVMSTMLPPMDDSGRELVIVPNAPWPFPYYWMPA